MPVADLILKNANVLTVDPEQPKAEAVAVKGDKILLVGGAEDLDSVSGVGTRIIDCQGKTLVPGFNDAHCHIFSFLREQIGVDLSPSSVSSISDIKAAIHNKAQKIPWGQWIRGNGYNDFYLAGKRHPTRWEIDEVAPHHPVVLAHRSLHACVLNSLALALAGITRETEEPPGGHIDRDLGSGEPNGLLFDMLGYIREKVMPSISEAELDEGITLASQHYLSQGITSLQDATVVNDLSRWRRFQHFVETGRLKSRLSMMAGIEVINQFQEAGLSPGSGDIHLRLGGAKLVPNEIPGHLYPPQPEFNRLVLEAHRAGFQVAIHASRWETVEAAITALGNAQSQIPRPDTRHRIEHCSECPPHLLGRLKELQAVVVTQPPFVYYSGERYLATVPADRQPWLYRIRSLLDGGLVVAASSDSPIVPANPLVGVYAAVSRQVESGQLLLPEERISAAQALAMYTINAAYATFDEGIKGSITPGKLADMVILSADPTAVPPERIKDIRVEMTILGGEVVWEA
ncbi:amidohydrolase [Chloroflexota bacterium]